MSFARTLSDVSNGDGSLGRTLNENSQNSISNNSFAPPLFFSGLKTKTPTRASTHKQITPSRQKVVGSASKKTPNNLINKQLRDGEGDRFIPSRVTSDINRANMLRKDVENNDLTNEDKLYQRAVTESLNTNSSNNRILHYNFGVKDSVSQYHLKKASSPILKEVKKRTIPHMPEKVLDAPEIVDDFYLNILDWSQNNILAIALAQQVYLWNAISGDITCLMNTGFENEYVTSLRWSTDVPNVLAVGLSAGRVQIWDASNQSLTRTMRLGGASSAARVPAVVWRDYLVTSGSRSGHIRHHDTRVAHHEVGVNDFHTQEVCGLAWSSDNRILAAGSNDNCISLWSFTDISNVNSGSPTHVLREHHAATKALAWCPWKPNLLCSGGGSADHTINFWNASTGSCIKSVDVASQVSGIIWNAEFREIITSHGDPKNQLSIWRYPDISKVTDLLEHQGRVLCIASSPNNEMIASCASDETLRIWHCFEVDKSKKRLQEKRTVSSIYTKGIR